MSYHATEIRDRARQMRAEGCTLRAIAAALDSNQTTICWITWDVVHEQDARHQRKSPPQFKKPSECWQCGIALGAMRYGHSRFCDPCRRARLKEGGQAVAVAAVACAIRAGTLPNPRGLPCADCPRPAEEYDHRDYSKPLEVDAVCRKCNARRGPGKWVKFKPVQVLAAERKAAASAHGSAPYFFADSKSPLASPRNKGTTQ